jgi:K+-transporting ATPase ATPase C chain
MTERTTNKMHVVQPPGVSSGPSHASSMGSEVVPAVLMVLVMTAVTGLVYPLAVTGIAQVAFPRQANGSLIERDGKLVGSSWIGQPFASPGYFWSRLSGTAPAFNAGASSGSNYGPLNPALMDAVKARVEALRAADPRAPGPVPVDLVTASGSGLDPHISVAAAEYQVSRVAGARGLDPAAVRRAIAEHTTPRWLGVIGEPAVNVLELNLALDAMRGSASLTRKGNP